jgi:hypothetical protein
MIEWKEHKLNELCEVTSSKRIFSHEYVACGIPFYRSKEIIDSQFADLKKGKGIKALKGKEESNYSKLSK